MYFPRTSPQISTAKSDEASSRPAFTLIELLISIATIGVLLSILLPAIRGARESSRHAVCSSNLRQLSLANGMYADANRAHYAPGASDFIHNLSRWHGTRSHPSQPFVSTGGPLSEYIDASPPVADARVPSALRACPTFARTLLELAESPAGFEVASGGYGYNNTFVGVVRRRIGANWTVQNDRIGAANSAFAQPCRTLEFADAAFASEQGVGGGSGGAHGVVEYSFLEPRFWPDYAGQRADPSIHFRHAAGADHAPLGSASAAWLDGHVSFERFGDSWSSRIYGVNPRDVGIGWFGPEAANEAFDHE